MLEQKDANNLNVSVPAHPSSTYIERGHCPYFHSSAVNELNQEAILCGILPIDDGNAHLSTFDCKMVWRFFGIMGESSFNHMFFITCFAIPKKGYAWHQ